MILVKFRVTEKEQWGLLQKHSFIYNEYVNTNDESYAKMRAYKEMLKELDEESNDYDISLIKVENINVIN